MSLRARLGSRRLRGLFALWVGFVMALSACGPLGAAVASAQPATDVTISMLRDGYPAPGYGYDSSSAATTPTPNTRADAIRGERRSGSGSRSWTSLKSPGHATKAGAGAGRSTRFVTTPRGTTFDIPKGWAAREADNGKGIVYQRPGATGNADMVRIMEPTAKYPKGYFRYYNEHGQPLGANGKPGPQSATHHSEDFQGPLAGWPGGG